MRILIVVILLFTSSLCYGQSYQLSGTLMDLSSHETIIGGVVRAGKYGGVSNAYGFYTITIPKDVDSVLVSALGYRRKWLKIKANTSATINIYLEKKSLQAVTIYAKEDKIDDKYTSITSIPIAQLKQLPTVGGEPDIMKALQHTPGIQAGLEGSAGVYVRGGSPDQNLILLDDVPVYNINHLFGFVSVFPTSAVKSADVFKAGFPARYGGRLSSVMDIRLKEGNRKSFGGELTISPIASSFLVESPIDSGRGSFLISGRRTWLDGITSLTSKIALGQQGIKGVSLSMNFYDFVAKANYKLNNKNRLYFSFYSGKDQFGSKVDVETKEDTITIRNQSSIGLDWGNVTSSLRMNTIFGKKLFGNATVAFTEYGFNTGSEIQQDIEQFNPYEKETTQASLIYQSSIKDYICKYDLEYALSHKIDIRAGTQLSFKSYNPGITVSASNNAGQKLDSALNSGRINNSQLDFYAEANFKPIDAVNLNVGLRYANYKTANYTNNSWQPRINLSVKLRKDISIKASYAYMNQPIHLLANSGSGLPTDLWLPATQFAPAEFSHQYVLGLYKSFARNLTLSVEGYYKSMNNVLEYKDGANFFGTFTNWENAVSVGKGTAQGVEFFLHKSSGNLNGWLGYTLAYNNRSFSDINNGTPFPYRYDRRHTINLFLNYELKNNKKKRRSISAAWQYSSGNMITLATKSYMAEPVDIGNNFEYFNLLEGLEGNYSDIYGILAAPSRNNYRMRASHRLDLTYSSTKYKRWGERTWSFTLYNAYARRNPYYIFVEKERANKSETYTERSIFSIFPSVSYTIKFDKGLFIRGKKRASQFFE